MDDIRELICSFNKIEKIPAELGRCKRLRTLHLNSNRIRVLPEELGNLDMLEGIVLMCIKVVFLSSNIPQHSSLECQ